MTNQVAGTPGLDPTLPDVTLILGGVERKLCFDFNAIVQAERHTGINLLKAVISDISATDIRGLLWAALLRENPKLTIDEVGSMITMRNVATIHQALITAWFGSVEQNDDEPKGEDQAQA